LPLGVKAVPPKRNPDSDAVTKILALYTLLLFEKKECCLRELAEKLVCSKQTILRLCARLGAFAPDFRTELREGERVYWLETPEPQTELALAPEALKCLAMCRNIAADLLPEEILHTSEEALKRAATLLADLGKRAQTMAAPAAVATPAAVAVPAHTVETPATATPPAAVEAPAAAAAPTAVTPPAAAAAPARARPKAPRDYSQSHEKITRLMKAIEERRVCIISYPEAGDAHPKERHFLPLRLVVEDHALHVEGWAVPDRPPIELLREATLSVHKIRKISVTLRAVSRNQDIEWKTQRSADSAPSNT